MKKAYLEPIEDGIDPSFVVTQQEESQAIVIEGMSAQLPSIGFSDKSAGENDRALPPLPKVADAALEEELVGVDIATRLVANAAPLVHPPSSEKDCLLH